jgi:hypothetical protein
MRETFHTMRSAKPARIRVGTADGLEMSIPLSRLDELITALQAVRREAQARGLLPAEAGLPTGFRAGAMVSGGRS